MQHQAKSLFSEARITKATQRHKECKLQMADVVCRPEVHAEPSCQEHSIEATVSEQQKTDEMHL